MRHIVVILSRVKHLSAADSIERCLATLSITASCMFGSSWSPVLSPVVIRQQHLGRVKR